MQNQKKVFYFRSANSTYHDRLVFIDDSDDEIRNRFLDNYQNENLNTSLIAAAKNGCLTLESFKYVLDNNDIRSFRR